MHYIHLIYIYLYNPFRLLSQYIQLRLCNKYSHCSNRSNFTLNGCLKLKSYKYYYLSFVYVPTHSTFLFFTSLTLGWILIEKESDKRATFFYLRKLDESAVVVDVDIPKRIHAANARCMSCFRMLVWLRGNEMQLYPRLLLACLCVSERRKKRLEQVNKRGYNDLSTKYTCIIHTDHTMFLTLCSLVLVEFPSFFMLTFTMIPPPPTDEGMQLLW